MQLLNAASSYISNTFDLKSIYLTYIRSILEQSAVVWHSSLTIKNRRDLERVQKAAVKVILKGKYTSYKNGLKKLNLQTLEERRALLCLRFSKKCLSNEKVSNFSPQKSNPHPMKRRKMKKYKENKTRTKRYKKSAIPYMQRLLNDDHQRKIDNLKN